MSLSDINMEDLVTKCSRQWIANHSYSELKAQAIRLEPNEDVMSALCQITQIARNEDQSRQTDNLTQQAFAKQIRSDSREEQQDDQSETNHQPTITALETEFQQNKGVLQQAWNEYSRLGQEKAHDELDSLQYSSQIMLSETATQPNQRYIDELTQQRNGIAMRIEQARGQLANKKAEIDALQQRQDDIDTQLKITLPAQLEARKQRASARLARAMAREQDAWSHGQLSSDRREALTRQVAEVGRQLQQQQDDCNALARRIAVTVYWQTLDRMLDEVIPALSFPKHQALRRVQDAVQRALTARNAVNQITEDLQAEQTLLAWRQTRLLQTRETLRQQRIETTQFRANNALLVSDMSNRKAVIKQRLQARNTLLWLGLASGALTAGSLIAGIALALSLTVPAILLFLPAISIAVFMIIFVVSAIVLTVQNNRDQQLVADNQRVLDNINGDGKERRERCQNLEKKTIPRILALIDSSEQRCQDLSAQLTRQHNAVAACLDEAQRVEVEQSASPSAARDAFFSASGPAVTNQTAATPPASPPAIQ